MAKDFQSAQELITYLEFEGLLKPWHEQIFIDEAHFLPHLGIILKNFFDQKQYQVIVTGSGSLKIFTDIGSELLVKSVASLFKYESLQKRLGMSKKSLVKVREVLDHTFLTYHIPPLPQTYKDTIRKHHKTYFIDVGLLRFLQKKSLQGYLGQIAENLVLTELIKAKPDHFKLYFWQRINATEVDFVLYNLLTEKLIPIEVKTKDTDNIPKAFSTFEKRFGDRVDYYIVINNSVKKVRQFQDKKVYFVPAFYTDQVYKGF